MKVAQLLPELNFGGVERGTIDLANFLVSQGHNALIISAGGVLEGELDTKVKVYKFLFQTNPCLL